MNVLHRKGVRLGVMLAALVLPVTALATVNCYDYKDNCWPGYKNFQPWDACIEEDHILAVNYCKTLCSPLPDPGCCRYTLERMKVKSNGEKNYGCPCSGQWVDWVYNVSHLANASCFSISIFPAGFTPCGVSYSGSVTCIDVAPGGGGGT